MYCTISREGNLIAAGGLTNVIQKTFNWTINEKRELVTNVKGFSTVKYFSYSKEWTSSEIAIDVEKVLFKKCKDFGITFFKEIE